MPSYAPTQVYLLFDERMVLHKPLASAKKRRYGDADTDTIPVENSSRILRLHEKMMELERRLLEENRDSDKKQRRRFLPLEPRACDRATIQLVHSSKHYESMLMTSLLSDQQLREFTAAGANDDLYYCRDTFLAASLACGGVVTCVDAVMNAHSTGLGPTRAIALVRPPGHHATRDAAMGTFFSLVFMRTHFFSSSLTP
jgi:acetoin utilization deacetylase AcuC-like enzyme